MMLDHFFYSFYKNTKRIKLLDDLLKVSIKLKDLNKTYHIKISNHKLCNFSNYQKCSLKWIYKQYVVQDTPLDQ